MHSLLPGAEPFFLPGNETGCLLVHGFTASPQEMAGLGRYLAAAGLTVHGVLLAGHGTHLSDLNETSWRDWFASVEAGYQRLAATCTQVCVMGLSLGGALSLHLAAHRPVAGVVSMAAPLAIDSPLLPLAATVGRLMPALPKSRTPDWFDPEAAGRRVAYDSYPLLAAGQLAAFLRHLRDDLAEVQAPALLMHSHQDRRVSPAYMPLIYDMLGSQHKRMVWIEGSNHILTEDAARARVWQLCLEFVANLTGAPTG